MGKPYRECPNCGAHLDPGERCDCNNEEQDDRESAVERENVMEKTGS